MTPLSDDTVERFRDLFRGGEQGYGQYLLLPDGKKKVDTKTGATPPALWASHLAGDGPFLGQIPIDENDYCHWGAIDIDDDDINHTELAASVEKLRLPLVVCRSKSGGAHCYLFLVDTAPAELVQAQLRLFAQLLGFAKNKNGRPVELFPKQKTLFDPKTNSTTIGNWINLPYYGGDETNRYAVNPNGDRLTLDEFLAVAEMKAITSMQLETWAPLDGRFADGPPCLQRMDIESAFVEGGRNSSLYNIGVYLKLKAPETLSEDLHAENQRFTPPLPTDEVTGIVRSLQRKDYAYTCSQLPIKAFCKKRECRTRPFGIDAFRKKRIADAMPVLSHLRKITSDPPMWIVKVDDTDLYLTSDELLSLSRFQKACLEKLTFQFPTMKPHEWEEIRGELLESVQIIEAPEDAGVIGLFKTLLNDFFMYRFKADERAAIVRGMPYEEEGIVYFRASDLKHYLFKHAFKEYDQAKLWQVLADLGAKEYSWTLEEVRGTVKVWGMPSLDGEQVKPFAPVELDTADF